MAGIPDAGRGSYSVTDDAAQPHSTTGTPDPSENKQPVSKPGRKERPKAKISKEEHKLNDKPVKEEQPESQPESLLCRCSL
jgi:hypothetical protein